MTRSWIHFTRGRFVRQARVGLGDLREPRAAENSIGCNCFVARRVSQ